MIFSHKKQEGFSLVETLVAISILLIAIVGPMRVSSQTAKSASYATEQIQAFFLAQEGLELAQASRDGLLLKNFKDKVTTPNPWTDFTNEGSGGIYKDCYNSPYCGLQWSTGNSPTVLVTSCSTSCVIYFTEGGRSYFTYSASGNSVTPFTRKITFTKLGTNAVKVISEVTWRTGSIVAEQKVVVDTYLYNIYGSS